MDFFGRDFELFEIKKGLESSSFEAILVYGRRRVGKTELIRAATQDFRYPLIHCEFKRAALSTNLKLLSSKITEVFNLPESFVFPSFDEAFDYIFKTSVNNPMLLVMDEFSFVLSEDSSIDSALSIAIDKYKHESRLKLIVSGSYVKLMTNLIDGNAPLYGRFNHILPIHPFDYYTASLFYPNYSNEEKIYMYSIFGGVAYFNSLIDKNLTPQENVLNLVIKRDSILEHEINEIILAETSKINDMNTLINLIGKGTTKYSDILKSLSMNKGSSPAYPLKKLIEMDVIKKVSPINDKNNKKRTFYSFKDNLIHFYYRYIFEHIDKRNIMNPEDFYEEFIERDLKENYIPGKFEEITAEFLVRISKAHRLEPVIYDIGTYIYNNPGKKISRQFDVVTLDKNGYISYECKYTNKPVGKSILEEEAFQTQTSDIPFYKLGFVSKNGFTKDLDPNAYNLFELRDFF